MTSRRIAIMQPYLFPYLGYFQLAQAVDEFWLLDTVQFIRNGWMNRNALGVAGQRSLFTLPVRRAPHDTLIRGMRYDPRVCRILGKIEKTLLQAYAGRPGVTRAQALLQSLGAYLDRAEEAPDFTAATEHALRATFQSLGIETPVRRASSLNVPEDLRGQARVIAICKEAGATDYVNMAGGRALYDAAEFEAAGLTLWLLSPSLPPYDQGGQPFLPGLSILDPIAHLPQGALRPMLRQGQTVRALAQGVS